MKKSNLLSVFIAGIAVVAIGSGCHRKPSSVTDLPGMREPSNPDRVPRADALGPDNTVGNTSLNPLGNGPYTALFNGPHKEDTETFKADTVYFDLDSATIKPSEESKLQDVASHFKANNTDALIVAGNCDERGTEKYNLSLGERRALAVREYLANLSMNPERIKTVTYGKSKPVDPGHNEEAWKKNRRDDIILVTPQ